MMIMCLSCGEFVTATKEGEAILPLVDECPDCGGQEFKQIHTDEVVQVEDQSFQCE